MSLRAELLREPYRGYSYGYPHKTAYRELTPTPLRDVWHSEPSDALTLYVHVPFCEMRCGFCNLFTLRGGSHGLESAYLDAVERQAERAFAALPAPKFRALVLGGGTPTHLSPAGLRRLLGFLAGLVGAKLPLAVETSPRTAQPERLELLQEAGATRVSLGVQSFEDADTRALGRPQERGWVDGAIQRIRAHGFPVLNLDLIYGAEGQTLSRFLASLNVALAHHPEELYLYPLYVRPLTGLGRRGSLPQHDARLDMYRAARERLLASGYEQVSMRFFRRTGVPDGTDTCCQEDGTVGLGCGARSYTRGLHYAFEWAVAQSAIAEVVRAFVEAPASSFSYARHGFVLDEEEQRRRYVLKTLLRVPGVPLDRYQAFFGSAALNDLPELSRLADAGLAELAGGHFRLTVAGLELSDAIGPQLYSARVNEKMAAYEVS